MYVQHFTPPVLNMYNIDIQGIWQTLLSKVTYNKYICRKRQQYVTVVHKDKNRVGFKVNRTGFIIARLPA